MPLSRVIVRVVSSHTCVQELREASKWEQGTKKDKNVDKEAKRQEQAARKAEAARLLEEEEAAMSIKKPTPNKAGNKKKGVKPAGPGAISAGGGLDAVDAKETDKEPQEAESFSATGIDNALDLMDVVNAKTDKASVGQQAAGIERHPEVSVDIGAKHSLLRLACVFPPLAKVQGEFRPGSSGYLPCRVSICSCFLAFG